MKNVCDRIQELYLDYVNNFLSVERFAEYYNMSERKANRTIELGRQVHERRVKQFKQVGKL